MHIALLLQLVGPGCIRVDDQDFANRLDVDGDGYRSAAHGGDDCDDYDGTVNVAALERCNDIDDDCDGVVDNTADAFMVWPDADGDGYGDAERGTSSCSSVPDGFVVDGTDCDDTTAAVRPGAVEDCNGIDDDCDPATRDPELRLWYQDADGDGFGSDESTVSDCLPPGDGFVEHGGDCDDEDRAASPGNAREICNDGVDNDCDGTHDGCGWEGEADLADAGLVIIGTEPGMEAGAAAVAATGLTAASATLVVGAPGWGRDASRQGDGAVFLVDANISHGDPQRLVDRTTARLTAADTTADSGAQHPAMGSSLAVGDADGDGITDLLVGAPGQGGGPGGAWLVAGPITGDRSLSASTTELWIAGTQTPALGLAGEAGRAVAMAELNGEPGAELLVAAPGARTAGGVAMGSVHVFPGAEIGAVGLEDGHRIAGVAQGGRFGAALAAVDLDGDGLEEIIVGAPTSPIDGAAAAGAVSFLPGPANASTTAADAVAHLDTGGSEDLFGLRVASVGDVTGDGILDVALAAPGRLERSGAVWIVTGLPASDGRVWQAAACQIDGPDSGDLLGAGVAAGGDADNDGSDDLLVGAPATGSVGRAWLLHGPLEGGNINPSTGGAAFLGEAVGDGVGMVLGVGVALDANVSQSMFFGLPGLSPTGGREEGGAVVVVPANGF